VRQREQRRLGRSGHRVERSARPELAPFGDEGRHGEAFHSATQLLWGAVAEVAHLDEGLDPSLAGRALGDDEDPDGFDGTVSRLGPAAGPATEGGPGGFDGVEGIGLAATTTLLTIRSVELDYLDSNPTQVAGQSRAIRARALDADLGHVPKDSSQASNAL